MAYIPNIPSGTRDFSPVEMQKREIIFGTIKEVFKKFGYQPIETPAMENLTTLLGKYGEEGDKLLFRILNSGNFLSGINEMDLKYDSKDKLSSMICEKGLRYDLTVPFARYVVQHQNEINFPFKRYQIQPVWRADKPQKGRYREFFQCDGDIIGSDSLLNEVELINIIDEVFSKLKIRIVIKLNNRKIIAGLLDNTRNDDLLNDFTNAIDQIEKIGIDASIGILQSKGATSELIKKLSDYLNLSGGNLTKLKELKKYLKDSEIGKKGIKELETIIRFLNKKRRNCKIELDLNLARGLNYYTGTIIEVKSQDIEIGSICGGGRYDNLTGIFGLEGISGVGVSFGADRIYDVMEQLGLFEQEKKSAIDFLILNFGKAELNYAFSILDLLREKSIRSELYPDFVKLRKQMAYANARKIPYVIIAGEEEIRSNKVTIKNMFSGEQKRIKVDNLYSHISKKIGLK